MSMSIIQYRNPTTICGLINPVEHVNIVVVLSVSQNELHNLAFHCEVNIKAADDMTGSNPKGRCFSESAVVFPNELS